MRLSRSRIAPAANNMCKNGHSKTKLVLVGGMPRSGTTLLSRVIGESFQIPFSPETHYFTNTSTTGRVVLERLPEAVILDSRVAAAYKHIGARPRSVETFRMLLTQIIGKSTVIGEKTPAHLMSFKEILAEDEHVIAVVIRRDFFEITESLRNVQWNHGWFAINLLRCLRYQKAAYAVKKEFPDRVFVIDYQALCENEAEVIAALFQWLPYGDYSGAQEVFDPCVEPWKRGALRPPQVVSRKVPIARAPHWLIAKIAFTLSNMVWPLKTVFFGACHRKDNF